MGRTGGWAEQVVLLAPDAEYYSEAFAKLIPLPSNAPSAIGATLGVNLVQLDGTRTAYDCAISRSTYKLCQFNFRTPKNLAYAQLFLWKTDGRSELYVDDYRMMAVSTSPSASRSE